MKERYLGHPVHTCINIAMKKEKASLQSRKGHNWLCHISISEPLHVEMLANAPNMWSDL